MKAFKVIKQVDGSNVSAWVGEKLRVSYDIGKKTIPNKDCYALFAFNTYNDARKWIGEISLYEGIIYECEIERCECNELKYLMLPMGTLFCSAIELTRKI